MNAIIGASGSGKSALAIRLARKFNLDIFSLDSLSIYKYIDIASAKPSKAELSEIKHYGIDLLTPNEHCSAKIFFDLLNSVASDRILIVGGSSFYLKAIIDGLSYTPKSNEIIESYISKITQNKANAYNLLQKIDSIYALKINPNDKYRIQKALEIFFLTNTAPSEFFKQNKKENFQHKINIFELVLPKEQLVSNITKRTESMFKNNIVDEVKNLVLNYADSRVLKAIGIKEVISYLNDEISLESTKELINKNTIALAKRQKTFNKTQFSNVTRAEMKELEQILQDIYKQK